MNVSQLHDVSLLSVPALVIHLSTEWLKTSVKLLVKCTSKHAVNFFIVLF
jgi:hypothetical protein